MKKILIVDDDPILGIMIQEMLEWKGYEVTLLRLPQETEQNIIEKQVDLVILDKLISGTDGINVCKWIRINEKTRDVPIIMITAMHASKQACLDAGADEFIAKPFEMEDFLSKVKKLLA
ncbi:PleD family two-component system response regulator [Flavimarina sp. Hel_I_48]|uniref:response regulator n=1 Tax=Flavimarina sp. Hel_I_48 TaxID=1392488 RepID=UPI0004DF9C4B|nr:response regulator [Flavimarina sp. Hel_I_48]